MLRYKHTDRGGMCFLEHTDTAPKNDRHSKGRQILRRYWESLPGLLFFFLVDIKVSWQPIYLCV
jgi:hypothetical protein